VGIEDHDSWLRRSYAPSGHASGWRHQGCVLMIGGGLLLVLLALMIGIVGR
jgi:hypothetical protein